MKYAVYLTDPAENDLRLIHNYLSAVLQAPDTAAKVLKRLQQSILMLDEMPERYMRYENEPWHSLGLRRMPVGNYLVFYVVDTATCAVFVLRVMHGSRNVEAHLPDPAAYQTTEENIEE